MTHSAPTDNVVHMTSPITTEWAAWMRAQGLSPRTITERTELLHRLGGNPLHLTLTDLLNELSRPEISNASRATYTNHLRAFYTWAIRMEYTHTDLTEKLPTPRVPRRQPRPITDKDRMKIESAPMRKRTRAMILLAIYQGLRIHEIAKLRAEDLDTENERLTVKGKGGATVILPLSDVIRSLAATMPQEGYWFPSGGGHIKANSASDTVGKAMRRAGVQGSAHSLRHYYGTQLLRRGANLRVVQELMRHANLATTAIYTEVDESEKRAAIASLAA